MRAFAIYNKVTKTKTYTIIVTANTFSCSSITNDGWTNVITK